MDTRRQRERKEGKLDSLYLQSFFIYQCSNSHQQCLLEIMEQRSRQAGRQAHQFFFSFPSCAIQCSLVHGVQMFGGLINRASSQPPGNLLATQDLRKPSLENETFKFFRHFNKWYQQSKVPHLNIKCNLLSFFCSKGIRKSSFPHSFSIDGKQID